LDAESEGEREKKCSFFSIKLLLMWDSHQARDLTEDDHHDLIFSKLWNCVKRNYSTCLLSFMISICSGKSLWFKKRKTISSKFISHFNPSLI